MTIWTTPSATTLAARASAAATAATTVSAGTAARTTRIANSRFLILGNHDADRLLPSGDITEADARRLVAIIAMFSIVFGTMFSIVFAVVFAVVLKIIVEIVRIVVGIVRHIVVILGFRDGQLFTRYIVAGTSLAAAPAPTTTSAASAVTPLTIGLFDGTLCRCGVVFVVNSLARSFKISSFQIGIVQIGKLRL